MPDIIITPSTGKLEFIDNSAQTTRRHSFTLDHSDGLVLDAPLSAAAISAPLNVINVTVNNSNANYPFVLAQSGETGAKNLLMDGTGGTYNPFTNTATIDISGNSATATLASDSTNLGGVAAASYVTLTGTQTLTNKTITGTFTGNLTGTGSWATNAVSAISATTATNSTQLNGQAASYYTNIPARLGYTPVNQAGDTIAGNLTVNGNFTVNGSVTAFSASNIYLSSSVITVEDNILTLNAFSPYLRYAGIEMYDSGSGTLSQLLWDGDGDYFFLTGSSVNGKIITGPDGQTNLTSGYIPKATAGYKLGNSLIYDNGTNIGIGITTPVYKTEIYSGVKTSAFTGLSISNFNNYDGTANSLVKSQLRFAILENPISTYDASQRTFAILESGNEANNSSSDGFFAISTRLNGAVAEKFRITSAGNVGIGTTNPVSILDVVGLNGSFPATSSTTQSTGSLVRLRNGNSNLVLDIGGNGGNGNWLQSTNRSDLSVNYPLLLNPNGGNVGIGITNPGYKLDVGVAGSDVISVRLTPGYERVRFNTFDLLGYNDGNLWMIGNNPTNTLVLGKTWDWDNQIGIAYTPGTVGNSGGILQIGQISKNNANYTHGITRLYTNGLERITIIANGNVGIGTTLPTTPLHVVGVISGSSFSGAGTGLTGTAASLTAGTATTANSLNTANNYQVKNLTVTEKIALGNRNAIYSLWHGGNQDLAWKKIADVLLPNTLYAAANFKVEVLDTEGNFGWSINCRPMTYFVACRRSGGTSNSYDDAAISGPINDYVRVVKTAQGVYELQIRQIQDWQILIFTCELITSNGTITYATGVPSNGSTIGTVYTVTTNGYTQYFPNVSASLFSGAGTGLTGTAASLTAGTVTTNANLTGDVTSTGNATTIATNAVTTTKINSNSVTFAKFQQVAALSVVGVSGNSTANVAAIAGSANQVLRVSNDGTALAFGQVNLAQSQAVTGTLAINNGGTGAATAQLAINALAGAVTNGQYLRGNGTNVVMSAIQAADVPTLNQNTTGNAATATILQTARNIGGVSFNGSADINLPGVNTAGNQNTSGNAATATTATNANAISFTEVELNAPATTSGTWTTGNGSEWGEPKFGSTFNQFRYTDGDGPYVEYNVPANHHACFISQLQWDTGGYADCHGVQSDGDLVFLRRINTRQLVENSNHGNTIQHDGSTVTFVGSGLGSFTKIRITNRSGRIHMTGIAFTRQSRDGYEGTGMVHPAQISHQGAGSGLNADLLDGYSSATANTANTIVLRDASGNFSAGTITATLSGNASTATTANALNTSNSYTGVNFIATGYFQTNLGQIKSDTLFALLTTTNGAQGVSARGILLGTSYDTTPGANEIRTTNNTSLYLNARGTGDIQFQTADSLKMMLLNNGNVGVGTSNPGRKLDVEGIVRTRGATGTGGFEIGAATTGAAKWRIEWDSASDSLDFNWVG